MIEKIRIQNFKTIKDTTIELGRFNVIIGENGSGKTNLLEGIAFGGSTLYNETITDSLPKETLQAKGVRNINEKDIYPYFENVKKTSKIFYEFNFNRQETLKFFVNEKFQFDISEYKKADKIIFDNSILTLAKNESKLLRKEFNIIKGNTLENKSENKRIYELEKRLDSLLLDLEKGLKRFDSIRKYKSVQKLKDFCIFSPENTQLRKFEDESQISPLGYRGDGLFKLVKEIYYNNKEQLVDIISNLKILDWFNNFIIEDNNFPGETKISIQDRFTSKDVLFLDQRNANEGFLFLLFYLTLFVSKATPSFFSIDNIEASFNPKLCVKLIRILFELSKKYNKQVILTTHNPFILDGLNLENEQQHLLVVRRNMEGSTLCTRVRLKENLDIKLSEAWMRGYLGGLPNNF